MMVESLTRNTEVFHHPAELVRDVVELLSRETEIVPGLLLSELLDMLNAPDSGFGRTLLLEDFTKMPDIRTLSEGKGYCSVVYSITFHTLEGECGVVVKVASTRCFDKADMSERELEANFRYIATQHRNELRLYELFKKYAADDLKLLKYYGGRLWTRNHSGLLLLEDVGARLSKETFSGIKTFHPWQIEQIITEIAKLQAYCCKFGTHETADFGNKPAMMRSWQEACNVRLDRLREEGFDFLTENRFAELRKLNTPEGYRSLSTAHLREGIPSMIVHDDFWVGNLLFDRSDSLLAMIDWQMGRFANFTNDLAQLLALYLPGEVRRQFEDHFLRFYVDELKFYLAKYDIAPFPGQENLTFDTVKRVYRESLKWAQVNVVFCFLNFDSLNPGSDGNESPIVNRLRCCLEDLWPEEV